MDKSDKNDDEFQKRIAQIQKLTPEQLLQGLRKWLDEEESDTTFPKKES